MKLLALFVLVLVLGCTSQTPGETMTDVVVLETTKGNIEIQLDRGNAPITTENFLSYVNEGFYAGTIFHRVIPGFMAQGGGFTPAGDQKQTHAPIRLEVKLSNARGTIAMARTSDPNSATSQFFINVADNKNLDTYGGGYAVFGKVIKGMEVVDAIMRVPTSTRGYMDDWPTEDILITKAYVKK